MFVHPSSVDCFGLVHFSPSQSSDLCWAFSAHVSSSDDVINFE